MNVEELLEQYAAGQRQFQNANFSGVDLRGAQLNDIDLHKTDLSGVDLSEAKLKKANLWEANLSRAALKSTNLTQIRGYRLNLSWADLTGVDLSFANLEEANLSGANFTKANLIHTNLMKALWENCNLQEAQLRGVRLDKSKSGVNLAQANLVGASLEQANLKGACLQGANLERVCLTDANLILANLDGANLQGAILTGANIYGASFENADLTGAIMPDGEVYRQPNTCDGEIGTGETLLENMISMNRQVIRTDKAPAPVGPYNQAIAANGQMIFVAGQIAIDPRLGDVVYTDDVKKQTEQVMANLEAILTASGATFENVVKTTVFLADMNDFATVNAVYAQYFPEATAPARACVQVSRLPKNVLVEIDCIAVV